MARFDGIKTVLKVVLKIYIIKSQQTFQNLVCFRFQQKYQKYTDLMSPSPDLTLFLSLHVTYPVLLLPTCCNGSRYLNFKIHINSSFTCSCQNILSISEAFSDFSEHNKFYGTNQIPCWRTTFFQFLKLFFFSVYLNQLL